MSQQSVASKTDDVSGTIGMQAAAPDRLKRHPARLPTELVVVRRGPAVRPSLQQHCGRQADWF